MFPLDELFEEVVDSSHVGMRKPEREIYELTCARMAIAADRSRCSSTTTPTTSTAARAFGMEAVHFGEDPWAALAEIDAILDRRGASSRYAADRHLARAARSCPATRAGQEREVGADLGDVEQHALQRRRDRDLAHRLGERRRRAP